MEELFAIIVIIGVYLVYKSSEWKSNSRTCPPGYHTDWVKMSEDLRTHNYDKNYVSRQNLAGKYDVKNTNDRLGI